MSAMLSSPMRRAAIADGSGMVAGMLKISVLAAIVGAVAACQSSSGGSPSLNTGYSSSFYQGCNTYDYSNTGLGLCPGRQWH